MMTDEYVVALKLQKQCWMGYFKACLSILHSSQAT